MRFFQEYSQLSFHNNKNLLDIQTGAFQDVVDKTTKTHGNLLKAIRAKAQNVICPEESAILIKALAFGNSIAPGLTRLYVKENERGQI